MYSKEKVLLLKSIINAMFPLHQVNIIWVILFHWNGFCLYYALHNSRNSRSQMFFRIGVLKNCSNVYRKTPLLDSLFNKIAGLQTYNLIKKKLQHKCFSVNIAKLYDRLFHRTPPDECFCNLA